jgi:hypothetical protein
MSFTTSDIEKEAEKIVQKIRFDEHPDGCCMSAAETSTTETWEIATLISDNNALSAIQKMEIFSKLDKEVQAQLAATDYDDFDLVYERLLQLIEKSEA